MQREVDHQGDQGKEISEQESQIVIEGDLHKAFDQRMARGQGAEAGLSQIEQRAAWRATAHARALITKLPKPIRVSLRRGAKALWWMMTPHRLPARIAARRARRSTCIAFSPRSGEGSTAHRNGNYFLTDRLSTYVYVPPRRPDDLDTILTNLSRVTRFSIVVPTYNTSVELLTRMLASVRAQWYSNWQLILADDASARQETRDFLLHINDPRIEVLLLPENGGISAATNAAIERADGDYVLFLDHDDELTEDCLYELAICISREDPDYIYSDEDKIDPQGRFTQPFFKPDWSPDTLMSTMYTCHVSCIRRSLMREVGPLSPEFDGSQDWDFILRITERAVRIAHIPKVLYHWRIIAASVSSDLAAKPYAVDAGRRAREAALARRGLSGALEPVKELPGYFGIRYFPRGEPLVSIVIPTRDNGLVLSRCLETLQSVNRWRNYEVTIIDNGSSQPETLNVLRNANDRTNYRVIRHDVPFNYSELNNLGALESCGNFILFLNDDTELLSADALERMIGYAQLPHVGAVGAKLLYPISFKVQHAGLVNLETGPGHAFHNLHANEPGYFARNLLTYNWSAVTGACLLIDREKFETVGGFDENFPVGYNDVDICFRLLRYGFYNVMCPSVYWLHHESKSRGLDHATRERRTRLRGDLQRLYLHHPDMLARDPFHNPNLHPNSVQFDLPK